MADKKRQHYVPRFYLRQFSGSPSGRTIGLFNLSAGKYVGHASIRDQACSDYFYGDDSTVEDAFQPIENAAAKILRQIIQDNALPAWRSASDQILLVFCLLLKARTAWAGEEVQDTFDQLTTAIMSRDPRFCGEIDKSPMLHLNPVLVSMANTAEVLILAADLHLSLAVNKTGDAFITCDNPVVCYNQFMEGKKSVGSHTGLACKGLQMFIPVSPRHCLIYCDSEVYNIGSEQNPVFSVNRSSDVAMLNRLQVINALENIYCDSTVGEGSMRQLVEDVSHHRRSYKGETHEFVSADNPNRYLYMHSRCDIKCGLELSFVKVLRKASEWSPGNQAVHVRDEELCRLHDRYREEVDAGNYPRCKFAQYLLDIGYYRPQSDVP